MNIAVYVPLLVCAALAVLAGPACRRVPPGAGAWVLTVVAFAGGLGTLWSLGLLTAVLLDDVPGFDRVEPLVPVPDPVSALAAGLLAWVVVRVIRTVGAYRRELRELRALAGVGADDILIADRPEPDAFAFATGVWRSAGTVYVTSGMLRMLDPAQQRTLLAHERAHLTGRHSTARQVATFAAAANPMLAPVRAAVEFLCERHADEAAAAATGNRGLVARTVAAAALARSAGKPAMAPGLHRLAVTDRVTALMAPGPRLHWMRLLPLALAVLVLVVAVLDGTSDFALIAAALV
jgi:Zn-dependent protease with chaperone function